MRTTKVVIDGETYNVKSSEEIGENIWRESGEEFLYQTKSGDFFLEITDLWIDGVRLDPMQEEPKETEELMGAARRKRVAMKSRIVPLTNRDAMIWCIKNQIPETFRGYLLDCI